MPRRDGRKMPLILNMGNYSEMRALSQVLKTGFPVTGFLAYFAGQSEDAQARTRRVGHPLQRKAALASFGADGLANLEASTGALTWTELKSVTERPSTHVLVMRNGILRPETSR
jgi:hypothetical protein